MCFSASASISAGIVLTGLGAVSVKEAKNPGEFAFAGIPFVFAVQQFTEGLLWMALSNPEWASYETIATYSFLVIAQVLWPTLLPLAFIMYEKEQKRKNIMKIFLGTGTLIAAYFSYCLLTYPVSASIQNHHIFYDLAFPKQIIPLAAFFYVISTAAAPLFSSNNKIKMIGLIIVLFYILSRMYFQPNLISVWCFFGTLIAVIVYMVMRENAKQRVGGNTISMS